MWFFAKDKGKRAGEVLFIDARNLGHMVDRAERALSDDDIATWLSEGEANAKSGDTTIIPGRVDAPTAVVRPPIPPRKKKDFKNVAEEAQDIIRRFHEMQATGHESDGGS